MIYTYINLDEWCGLWRTDAEGSTLIYEHHNLTIPQLSEIVGEGCFELEVFNYPDGVEQIVNEGTLFEEKPLSEWRGWAEEPERMKREHGP